MTAHGSDPRTDETGAALLLVIVFITVFGLVTAALLDLASTGFKTSTAIAEVRDDQHRVEGAMEAAINRVRNSSTIGYDDVDCPSPLLEQDGVTVTCTGEGITTGGVDDSFPKYALMALGSGSNGINVLDGNDDFTIDGGAHSNGVVVAGSSSGRPNQLMRVFGDLMAVGSCGPASKIVVTGVQQCSGAPSEPDPAYPAGVDDIGDLNAVDPLPVCGGGVIRFLPGLYSVVPATLAQGCSGQWWFTPGVYYLDFNDVWSISGTVRVGTTGAGTNTCDTSGAQFIMGGSTRIRVPNNSGNQLVMCAGPRGDTNQHLAIYGLSSGSRTSVSPSPVKASSATSTSTPAWSNAGLATTLDSNSATVSLQRTQQATVTLDDFIGTPTIQDGATISQVTLRYRHCPGSSTNTQFVLDTGDGTTSRTVGTSTSGSCNTLRTVNVLSDINALDGQVTWRRLKNLRIHYEASRGNGGGNNPIQSTLDGVELQVTFVQPGFEAHTCPSNCALLDATGSNSSVQADGTLYAPTARVAVQAHNKGVLGFNRGVIARTIDITISSSSKQDTAPFSLPGEDGARVVVFEATIDGEPYLRARVRFDDTGSLPGREATVLAWSVLR